MKNRKNILFSLMGVALLIVSVTGISIAFFNYTRTGQESTFSVGRIYFNSTQNGRVNLDNLFPINPTDTQAMNDPTKVGTVVINIEGDTDYVDGVEYLVSSEDTNIMTSSGKMIPISLDVTVTGLGTPSNNYFVEREDKDTTMYKKLVGDTLVGDQMLLVGYIKRNTTLGTAEGVDGSITIKAYLDTNKISVSDTIEDGDIAVSGYVNGTNDNWVDGRTVFTTSEWNAIQSNGVSFKVKVEANEGIWVKGSLEEIMKVQNLNNNNQSIMDNVASEFVSASTGINFGAGSSDTNGKGVYMRAGTQNDAYPILYYRGAVEDNNVIFNNKCWKAVRTTDTGGVKLIYNGEITEEYENINQDLSNYANLNKENDVTDVYAPFNFDSSDNTWNIELTGASNTEFEFKVPSGDNYNLVMTGTSGSACGGTMTFYKDDFVVNSTSQGGGNAMNLSYSYGNLTSSNKIKMTFNGNSSITCPITLKIKMKQNSSDLSQNQYTLVTNGIFNSKKWTFDEAEKKWYAIVPNSNIVKISFGVVTSGNYVLKYTATGGLISIKKGDNVLSDSVGTDVIVDLGTVTTTDEYSVEYQHMAPGSGKIEVALLEHKYLGDGCDNVGADTHIDVNGEKYAQFSGNGLYNSPAYVGYMWGTVYELKSKTTSATIKFGSGFTYSEGIYKLINTENGVPNTKHYTCFTASDTCDGTDAGKIYYVTYRNGSDYYYIELENAKSIEDAIQEMQINTNSSNAKIQIEKWYRDNMTSVTGKLEDTIWCNDRSIGRYNGWEATGISVFSDYRYNSLIYSSMERSRYATPSLACANKNDAFTVSNGNGNKKLVYPVALLTEDEMALAGSYLASGSYYWTLSPIYFNPMSTELLQKKRANVFIMADTYISNATASLNYGLRPAISIKPGLPIIDGEGTVSNPYVIE